MTPDAETVSREDWAVRMRSLPLHAQAGMLAAAVTLLEREDSISAGLEAELFVLAEQINHSIARAFESQAPS